MLVGMQRFWKQGCSCNTGTPDGEFPEVVLIDLNYPLRGSNPVLTDLPPPNWHPRARLQKKNGVAVRGEEHHRRLLCLPCRAGAAARLHPRVGAWNLEIGCEWIFYGQEIFFFLVLLVPDVMPPLALPRTACTRIPLCRIQRNLENVWHVLRPLVIHFHVGRDTRQCASISVAALSLSFSVCSW